MGIEYRIQPPFTLYTLHVEPGQMNSPSVPAVHLVEANVVNGHSIRVHTITPTQARELAVELLAAAQKTEVA